MTNMKNGLEVVLKADASGRLRMPAEKREKLLDEFERSGLSGTKFAALSGVNYQTFASWVVRRKRERQGMKASASGPDQVRWLEAMGAGRGWIGSAQGASAWWRMDGGHPVRAGAAGSGAGAGTSTAIRLMLSFPGSLKVFVAIEPCDMRKGFNGLHAAVTERLGEDPKGGALFVFCNRRRTRIKILCWDGTGLWVLTKRLEEGTFAWPKVVEPNCTKLALTPQALAMLTDGVDLRGGKLRPWYERES